MDIARIQSEARVALDKEFVSPFWSPRRKEKVKKFLDQLILTVLKEAESAVPEKPLQIIKDYDMGFEECRQLTFSNLRGEGK